MNIETFLSHLTTQVNHKLIYGDPIQHGELTIISVSKISYAFGFGFGQDTENKSGQGGGGFINVVPIGFIEIIGEEAKFVPIQSTSAAITLLTAGIVGFLILKGVAALSFKSTS